MPDLDALADALYAAPPAGFVAARDEAASTARADGDRATAAALAGLRRPTVGAWLVNLLAITRPDLVTDFVALAGPLRAAQSSLRGDELRALSAQRRSAIAALVDEARTLARSADPALSKPPLAEVEATFSAALASEAAAAAVSSGRLVKSISYDGFGEPAAAELAGPGPARRTFSGRLASTDGHSARAAAGSASGARRRDPALDAAREAEAAARAAVDAATAAEREASAALADAADRAVTTDQAARAVDEAIADAERRLAALQQQLTALRADRAAHQTARRAAARAHAAAEKAVDTRRHETHEAQERLFAARRRVADAGG